MKKMSLTKAQKCSDLRRILHFVLVVLGVYLAISGEVLTTLDQWR